MFFQNKKLFSQLRNYFHIINIKFMNTFKTSITFPLGSLNLFSVLIANARSCNCIVENKPKIKCLSAEEKCIDKQEKEFRYEVEV